MLSLFDFATSVAYHVLSAMKRNNSVNHSAQYIKEVSNQQGQRLFHPLSCFNCLKICINCLSDCKKCAKKSPCQVFFSLFYRDEQSRDKGKRA